MFFSVKATVPSPGPGVSGLEVYVESDGDLLLLDATNYIEEAIRGFYNPFVDDPDDDVGETIAVDHEPPYESEWTGTAHPRASGNQGHFDPANEVDTCCANCPDTDACNTKASPRNEFLLYTQYVEGSTRVAIWDPANPEETVVIGYVLQNEVQ